MTTLIMAGRVAATALTTDHEPTLLEAVVPDRVFFARLAALELSKTRLTTCKHCGGRALRSWGHSRRGLRRANCRTCRRTCTAATGTPLAHVHSLDKLRQVAIDMLASVPDSCRRLGARLGLDRMTVWRWRRLIAAIWDSMDNPTTGDAPQSVARATVVLRESRKASREWVAHEHAPTLYPAPDRLRWIDYRQLQVPLPDPMTPHRIALPLPAVAPGAPNRAPSSIPQPADESPAVAPVDDPGITARTLQLPAAKVHASNRGPRVESSARCLAIVADFRQFLAAFRGPATRHLWVHSCWYKARQATA